MQTDFRKQFDNLMQNAQKQMSNKNYQKALELVNNAEGVLTQHKDKAELSMWAYVFDYQRYLLYELNKKEDALEVCREAIAKFKEGDWAYLPEYNVVRATKRASYNMLAWAAVEKDSNEHQLNEAIQLIESCFSTISPIESESVFDSFYETKALVYKKATEFNSDKYKRTYFSVLKKISNKKINIEDERILKDLKNSDFIAFMKDDPIKKLKKGEKGETWQQALNRYTKFYELTLKPTNDSYDRNRITINKNETVERIAEFEKKNNCQIPIELKKLYLEHGTFSIRDEEELESIKLYSNKESKYALQNIGGLIQSIDELWGGKPVFKKSLSAQDIAYLNTNYFVFGHYLHDDDAYSHFYFDRNGKFGVLTYDQGDFPLAFNEYLSPLLKSSLATLSLDELLSSQVNFLIKKVLEEEEEE